MTPARKALTLIREGLLVSLILKVAESNGRLGAEENPARDRKTEPLVRAPMGAQRPKKLYVLIG